MIEHELLLLGLLKESPKHGYEIKKKIKEIIFLFAGINLKSIYYPLRILEKKGLVKKRVYKEGARPPRFIYELTPKGERRFQALLLKSFLDFKRPEFSLDLSLYFLNYIKPDIVRRRLRARLTLLEKLIHSLVTTIHSLRHKKPFSLVPILEHNLQMVKAEHKFLRELIGNL